MSSAAARTAFVTSQPTYTASVSEIDLIAANDVQIETVKKVKRSRLLRTFQSNLPQPMKILHFFG